MEIAQQTIYMFTLTVCLFVIGFLFLEAYRITIENKRKQEVYKKYPQLRRK